MPIRPIYKLSLAVVTSAAIFAAGLLVGGCKGSDDSAPTNTKNSTYIDSGKTAADKIGAERGARRRPGVTPPTQ